MVTADENYELLVLIIASRAGSLYLGELGVKRAGLFD